MKFVLALSVFALAFMAVPGLADMPNSNRNQPQKSDNPSQAKTWYEEGVKLAKEKNYEKELTLFQKTNASEPDNPDNLNMLAFTQRKLGRLDEAFANYEKALRIRPKFAEAREYLGEAHIQAALKQIEILKTYGEDAKEEREDLIRALQDAAAGVNSSK